MKNIMKRMSKAIQKIFARLFIKRQKPLSVLSLEAQASKDRNQVK